MRVKQSITTLLKDIDFVNPELGKIIRSLRNIVLSIAPDAEEKVMYGGIVFTLPNRMFCGLFLRKNHVSVEFDLGYLLKDPEQFLEGSGKFRRHLKLFNNQDVKTKKTEYFIKQSYKI